MEKQELKQIVQEMIAAPSCCQELKDAAQKWLDGKAPKKVIVVPGKIINIVI